MGIDYCPETNSVENGLEGRGNSDWRKVQSLGPRFRMNRTTPALSKNVNIEIQRTINLHVILNWFDT
jgi:hypothetical protein